MIETVSVRLDEKLIKEVKKIGDELKSDRSEVIRRLIQQAVKDWKLKRAIELLKNEEVSIGKASEIAEITLYEMINVAADNEIAIDYNEKEFLRDLKRFNL